MRICMVTSVPLPPAEGVGYYVWNLSRFLIRQGHHVQVVTRGQPGKPFCEEVDGLLIWRPRFYPLYPFHVHLHGLFVQPLVRRLENEVDLFHLHTPMPPPIQSRRPYLMTVHTPMKSEASAIQVRDGRSLVIRLQLPVLVQLEHRLFADAGTITAVAESVATELEGYGLDPDQVSVLGNGVDTTLFAPEPRAATGRTGKFVLAAGRLDVRKGLEDLIEAMTFVVDRYPEVRLCIAGSGPLHRQLVSLARSLGLGEAVQFLGHVERDRLIQLYRDATVFAHAAHYEGLPTVLLEAMACRKAVVSTAVSGALDVIEDGANGVLVPSRAPQALAEEISRLLGDAALCERLGSEARKTIETRFSWQVVGGSYLRRYRDLTAEAA